MQDNRITIYPGALHGEVLMPPSKSLSHRAILAAALSDGWVQVDNLIYSEDIHATLEAVEIMGAVVQRTPDSVQIRGIGKACFTRSSYSGIKTIQCGESGSTLRFMVPIATALYPNLKFEGRGRLKTRPIDAYFPIFEHSHITYGYENGLPLTTKGCLKAGRYCIKGDVSSQYVTGLLMAAPLLEGETSIVIDGELESKAYVELTLDVLKAFDIAYERQGYSSFKITGKQTYAANDYVVEGDYSQSVFWIVSAMLGGELSLKGLKADSQQGDAAVVKVIESMGGKLVLKENVMTAFKSETKGVQIDASEIPDLIPALAVLAAFSKGETTIYNGSRLRIKESDRISSTVDILTRLGADISETSDGMVIRGKEQLEGGVTLHGHGDHRIVMAGAIAATRCKNPVVIEGCSAVRKSYPHFFDEFKRLGGRYEISE